MVDYEAIIIRIINNQTYAGGDGATNAVMIIDYLHSCPFIDTVAGVLGMKIQKIYDTLRYYLTNDEFDYLLVDLYERKKVLLESFKKQVIENTPREFSRYYS